MLMGDICYFVNLILKTHVFVILTGKKLTEYSE